MPLEAQLVTMPDNSFGFDLDMVYESKAYDMIEFNKDEKSCFWCIGNSNLFR